MTDDSRAFGTGALPRDPMSDSLVAAVVCDVSAARVIEGDPLAWLHDKAARLSAPIAVEVWVFDPTLTHVVLVEHRWRGWVPPGGSVEVGELPKAAAQREVFEETGLQVQVDARPAFACLRSYRHDWAATLALTYVCVSERATLTTEPGQPGNWSAVSQSWCSVFDSDRARMLDYLADRLNRHSSTG